MQMGRTQRRSGKVGTVSAETESVNRRKKAETGWPHDI